MDMVIGGGRRARDRPAMPVPNALGAMQRRAVLEHVELPVIGLDDAVDAEIAPLRRATMDAGRQHHDNQVEAQRDDQHVRREALERQGCDREAGGDAGRRTPAAKADLIVPRDVGSPSDHGGRDGHDRREQQQASVRLSPSRFRAPGRQAKLERQEKRILEHLGKDLRGDQRREDAAQHAAHGHPHVELGQVPRVGAALIERAMGDEGRRDERGDAEPCRVEPRLLLGLGKLQQSQDRRDGVQRQQDRARNQRALAEHDDERREIEGERDNPDQGADATSVATWVVKAVSSADGTNAKPTQDARVTAIRLGARGPAVGFSAIQRQRGRRSAGRS